ncbi:hypothetical protein ACROYT_G037924 [Oculina patagonica]
MMGVRGLTSYINSIGTLWTQIELRRTKLIIDGSGLCNYLYKINGYDCRCGGQYDEFYNAVLSFFEALDSKGVESFVVLDGAQDPSGKKLETHKKRATERIQTSHVLAENLTSADGDNFLLPLLSKLVFIQALKDCGIKFAVCDGEADAEIASLASSWSCPVLGNDSDFFIFDIKAGYIPLSFFNWKSNRLTANVFYREQLSSHLGIRAELIPLLASLAGNDYVSWDLLAEFRSAMSRGKGPRFASIANLLSELPNSSTEEALESALQMVSSQESREQLKQAIKHSLQEYTITESNLLRYFESGEVYASLRTQNGREIEEWILPWFRDGRFSAKCMSTLTTGKNFLRVQVENCGEVSANQCSQSLRQLVYGILNDAGGDGGNITMVQEWDREGLTVKSSKVLLAHQKGVVPGASVIPRLDKEERSMALLDALDSNTAHIRSLLEKFKLIAASLRFLINNAQPMLEMNHLIALLCCCVNMEEGSIERESAASGKPSSQPFDVRAAHSFSQWQCVLRDAIDLNFILLEPLATPCIHKTFNGRLVHYLREELDQGRTPEELLLSSRSRLSYKDLYNAVTDGLKAKLTKDRNVDMINVFAFILFIILLVVFCYIMISLIQE